MHTITTRTNDGALTELDLAQLDSVIGGKPVGDGAGGGCRLVRKVVGGILTTAIVCGAGTGGAEKPHAPEGPFHPAPPRPPVVQTTRPTPPPILGGGK